MSKLLDIFRPLLLQTVVSLNQVYAQYPPCQAQLQQVHAVLGQLPADQLFAVGRVIGRVVPDHLMALLSGDLTPMLQVRAIRVSLVGVLTYLYRARCPSSMHSSSNG
jgi:hypothetical protein